MILKYDYVNVGSDTIFYVNSLDYVLFFALKMLQRQFQSLSLPINMVTYTVEDACYCCIVLVQR